jgi:uncharacterized protein (DUF1330 family)
MGVYAMAQLKIHDRSVYGRYQARFMEVFRKYQGRLLAADESPSVIEGEWDRNKVVLMWFPSEAAFREWEQSPAYQEIAQDRKAGAATVALLVKAISSAPE